VTVDVAFADVMAGCADERREQGWITPDFVQAYSELHRMGWAHSVEAWDATGDLAGGLYGVSIGGLFAGESMFHRATDASKVALVALVGILGEDGQDRLLDVQWRTEHLATLGVIEIPRREYLSRLDAALSLPSAFD
jgi:leucyl/phenylalanyl-tRNA--protein transferase